MKATASWTKKVPTQEGWYRMKNQDLYLTVEIGADPDSGELETFLPVDGWKMVTEMVGAEWQGPIKGLDEGAVRDIVLY
jgi:hypothetical protein